MIDLTAAPSGQPLIDFAAALAAALGPHWEMTYPFDEIEDGSPTWPTKATVTDREHGWEVCINGSVPATPGRVTMWTVDQVPSDLSKEINWDGAPQPVPSATFSIERKGGVEAIAAEVRRKLLDEKAQERATWLFHHIQDILVDRARKADTVTALRTEVATPLTVHDPDLPGGSYTCPGVTLQQDGESWYVSGGTGVDLTPRGSGKIRVDLRGRTVSLRTAAAITRLLAAEQD
jgi:hypothetical protein